MEEGQRDGSEAETCGRPAGSQAAASVGRRQREASKITEVGQQVAVIGFHGVYMLFVVGFFLWKDTDFLFVADTKYLANFIVCEKKRQFKETDGIQYNKANS